MLLVAIQMYAFQKSKVRARTAEHSRGDQVKKLEILVRGSKSLAGHGGRFRQRLTRYCCSSLRWQMACAFRGWSIESR